MKFTLKRILGLVLCFYCMISFYLGYWLVVKKACENKKLSENSQTAELSHFVYRDDIDDDDEDDAEFYVQQPQQKVKKFESIIKNNDDNQKNDVESMPHKPVIEIWSKAAIGTYLWEHILDGSSEEKDDGLRNYGHQQLHNIHLRFRSGPGVIQTTVPRNVKNLVLVINGHDDTKIKFARAWLDYLPLYKHLKNVAVVLLGNEQCDNSWLSPYLKRNGGLVKVCFLIYDSAQVDNQHIFQWPLGVATYRSFPKTELTLADLETPRPYVCNFLGTIYKHSSREMMIKVIKSHNLGFYCYLKYRPDWMPQESDDSMSNYINILSQSDLTLNPVGINTECYRIYEAMSFGSVPVVEDRMTQGSCGNSSMSSQAPLRLLKQMAAPIIFLKSWAELPAVIEREMHMTLKEKINRRKRIFNWYERFKNIMRDQFLNVIDNHFFQNFG